MQKTLSPVLIHPGWHKTGTTFLQECVFSDRTVFSSLCTHQEIHDLVVSPHDLEFDPKPFSDLVNQRRLGSAGATADVVSSEILSGTMFFGSRDSAVLAERLRAALPEARILLTVRAQVPWVASVYLEYLKRGGRKSLPEFLSHSPEPGYHWFSTTLLKFDLLASKYAKLFGPENVLVLPQELLLKDRPAFLSHLFDFAGVGGIGDAESTAYAEKRGKSPPLSGTPFLRLANLFRSGPMNPEGPGFLSPIGNSLARVSYKMNWRKDVVRERYQDLIRNDLDVDLAASNRELQHFVPVELGELGYET